MATNFRISAKNFALTYSNVDQQTNLWSAITKEELSLWLRSLTNGGHAMVSRELHADGAIHYHAWVQFPRKKDIRNATFFDYQSVHPNIQACRNVQAWKTYIRKDGDYTEDTSTTTENDYFTVCKDLEEDKPGWITYCISNKISFQYMELIWKMCHVERDCTITEDPPEEAVMCNALQSYVPTFNKPLVIVGPSGCGKTTWAIRNAPKPICFVSHMDQLKHFDPQFHRSIVFDDMSFSHMPREAQIHLLDQHQPRAIHRRYGVTTIPAGTKKIFTANYNPFLDDAAIIRRRDLRTVIV